MKIVPDAMRFLGCSTQKAIEKYERTKNEKDFHFASKFIAVKQSVVEKKISFCETWAPHCSRVMEMHLDGKLDSLEISDRQKKATVKFASVTLDRYVNMVNQRDKYADRLKRLSDSTNVRCVETNLPPSRGVTLARLFSNIICVRTPSNNRVEGHIGSINEYDFGHIRR